MMLNRDGAGRAAVGVAAYQAKSAVVVDALREAILSGRYRPGERLQQMAVADDLGVSPTPVREALRQLEAEGLVVHHPHRGVRVADVSLDEMAEVTQMRAVLAGLAARMAVERLTPEARAELVDRLERIVRKTEAKIRSGNLKDWTALVDDFHRAVLSAARAPRIERLVTELGRSFPRDIVGLAPEHAERGTREHRDLLEAIRADNAEAAERVMCEHVNHSGAARIAFLRDRLVDQRPARHATARPRPGLGRREGARGRGDSGRLSSGALTYVGC